MPTTFTPPVPPSQPLDMSMSPKVIRAEFGDGYSAGIRDGIYNQLITELTLNWTDISTSERDTIVNFMLATGGADKFFYTLPTESTQKSFYYVSMNRRLKRGTLVDLSVTIKEVP